MATRKARAKEQNMKITYYEEISSSEYHVGILGSRKIPYILQFNSSPTDCKAQCNCMDFNLRKNICKHLYLVMHLAKANTLFNTTETLPELQEPEKIQQIQTNLLQVIDKKKLEENNSTTNTVSIERDEYCPICMGDLETNIQKCTQCEHVVHSLCLQSWWETASTHWNNKNGHCPYCRATNGFAPQGTGDAWDNFQFQQKN